MSRVPPGIPAGPNRRTRNPPGENPPEEFRLDSPDVFRVRCAAVVIYYKNCEAPNKDLATVLRACGTKIRGRDDYTISFAMYRPIFRAVLKAVLLVCVLFFILGADCACFCSIQNESIRAAESVPTTRR